LGFLNPPHAVEVARKWLREHRFFVPISRLRVFKPMFE
jgi:hypothetical protein